MPDTLIQTQFLFYTGKMDVKGWCLLSDDINCGKQNCTL